ncbi:alanine--tRNA ligase, partial [Francisella orientalis]
NLLDKLQLMLEQLKNQEKEIAKLKKDLLSGANSDIKELIIGDIKVIIANLENVDIKTLREKIDDYKSKKDKIVSVLSTINADKVQFVIGVSKSITPLIKAGDIAKEFSGYIDGKGGGRPDMAQGGGNNSTNIDKALSDLEQYILNIIK